MTVVRMELALPGLRETSRAKDTAELGFGRIF